MGVNHAALIKIEDGARETSPYEQNKIFKELGITFREDCMFVIEAEITLIYSLMEFIFRTTFKKYHFFKIAIDNLKMHYIIKT